MIAILRKEINVFLSSLVGYMAIVVFLLLTGMFLWLFPDTSVLDYGFATMEGFFALAPYVLLFLIPAVTMRSFSEEFQSGTIELLFTKPLKDMEILMGKYLAACLLVVIALVPTLIYFASIYVLGAPAGNIDTGGVAGSYLGLLFLCMAFASIGVFSSAMTQNQIAAFMLGVFLCFFVFAGFDYLSRLDIFFGRFDSFVQWLGIQAHYDSISRGVVDSRDVLYFLSVAGFFLILTRLKLSSRKW